MEIIEIIVEQEQNLFRLDKLLNEQIQDMSRTSIQDIIKIGNVLVNGKIEKSNYKVKTGDKIEFKIPPVEELDINPENIPLDIVYEDSDMLVVNKQSGMVVHPSFQTVSGTLVNALLYHCKDLSGINGVARPGIVHRIDKDTSGLLMVAKNDLAHKELSQQLKDKTTNRRYICLVHGEIPHEKGTINAPIGRDKKDRQKMVVTEENAKEAITHFHVIERFKDYTLVECKLETGRTHQIRVHMNFIGFPVVGDPKYGHRKDDSSWGQYLHARLIGFNHPRTGEYMEFEMEAPQQFLDKLNELRNIER